LVLFELPIHRKKGLVTIIGSFQGHIDGLNDAEITKALKIIKDKNISKVFVDGSNLGGIVKVLKLDIPKVQVYTFFHNVEALFFWGALKNSKSPRALAVMITNFLAERKSVKYSDKLISLSARDSGNLMRIYGRAATHLSPMSLVDKLSSTYYVDQSAPHEQYALFVGGAFYANREGIKWFVKKVIPFITLKVYIIGKGFENLKPDLELDGRVQVIGSVVSLEKWYRDAHCVIAPIFDGSGMKTKVAEALMYGKKVIGTSEAFSGYEEVVNKVGWECNTSQDFVEAIRRVQKMTLPLFNLEMRKIYEERYSPVASKAVLKDIMNA
jgi:glycosyltransferase involved in cell wall biosynthesis